MAFDRLNQALDKLAAAVDAAVEHIHEPQADAPTEVEQAAAKVEALADKLQSRVPEENVPATDPNAGQIDAQRSTAPDAPDANTPADTETVTDVPADKPVT